MPDTKTKTEMRIPHKVLVELEALEDSCLIGFSAAQSLMDNIKFVSERSSNPYNENSPFWDFVIGAIEGIAIGHKLTINYAIEHERSKESTTGMDLYVESTLYKYGAS